MCSNANPHGRVVSAEVAAKMDSVLTARPLGSPLPSKFTTMCRLMEPSANRSTMTKNSSSQNARVRLASSRVNEISLT